MGVLEETQQEDERFRTALKDAMSECETEDMDRIFQQLMTESKIKQRAIMAKYNKDLEPCHEAVS